LSSKFRKNVCFQLTFESIEIQFWVTKNIAKKLDANDHGFVHLTLILLLHYLVKCIVANGQTMTSKFHKVM